MNCPIDATPLTMSERQGIEIDYCPTCRGLWLDRGELDKIIERSADVQPDRSTQRDAHHTSAPQHTSHSQHQAQPYHKKKRESFLGDLFDF